MGYCVSLIDISTFRELCGNLNENNRDNIKVFLKLVALRPIIWVFKTKKLPQPGSFNPIKKNKLVRAIAILYYPV